MPTLSLIGPSNWTVLNRPISDNLEWHHLFFFLGTIKTIISVLPSLSSSRENYQACACQVACQADAEQLPNISNTDVTRCKFSVVMTI